MVNIANAVAAYGRAAAQGTRPGMEARTEAPSFGAMVEEGIRNSVDTAQKGEQMSAAATLGKADLTDVVTAVSNAEVTVQTVVAVRDKVLAAYQEILRMPI